MPSMPATHPGGGVMHLHQLSQEGALQQAAGSGQAGLLLVSLLGDSLLPLALRRLRRRPQVSVLLLRRGNVREGCKVVGVAGHVVRLRLLLEGGGPGDGRFSAEPDG